MTSQVIQDTLGVVLAGGLSRRMGATDKFHLEYQGKSLLQHTIDRASPQVHRLIISANGDLSRFNKHNLKVISDGVHQHSGPLAGIVSVMSWAQKKHPEYKWLMSFASDTPSFPLDCAHQLKVAAETQSLDVVIPSSGGRNHYAFTLWSTTTLNKLNRAIEQGERALHSVISSLNFDIIEFDDQNTPFFNINTPDQWQKLNEQPAR